MNGSYYIIETDSLAEGAGLQPANITVDNLPAVVARASGIEQARARPS